MNTALIVFCAWLVAGIAALIIESRLPDDVRETWILEFFFMVVGFPALMLLTMLVFLMLIISFISRKIEGTEHDICQDEND